MALTVLYKVVERIENTPGMLLDFDSSNISYPVETLMGSQGQGHGH